MRTTHLSRRQEARATSRIVRRRRAARLTAVIAMFLVAVAVPVQGGSTGGRSSGLELAAPANDDFANATVLGSDAGSLIAETNEEASAEAGEPNHNGVAPSRSVWYQWAPTEDGTAVLSVTTEPYSDHYIVVAVYTGSAVNSLTAVAARGGFGFRTVNLEFAVTGGTTYHLVVDGSDSGETGSFDLAWSIPSPLNDDFADATVLGTDAGTLAAETNQYADAEAGEPNHDGLAGTPARSVWYQWTPAVDGTAVFEITVPSVPDDWDMVLAAYTGSAVDALNQVAATSSFAYSAALQFEVVAGTTYHLAVDGHDSSQYGTFDLTWVTHVAPLNDDFAGATLITGDTGSLSGETNEWATAEPDEPNHDGLAGTPAHSVWYQWTPSVDAAASFTVTTPVSPDDWDSVLAVYAGTEVGALTEVASNRTVGTYLPLDFSVTGGTTYHLAVDGQTADQMGSFALAWSVWPDSGVFTVTKTTDSFDGVCDADCSLREAVHAANQGPGDDTIHLPAGIYELTIDTDLLAEDYGSLDIEREQGTTTIIGAGRDVTIIDASALRTEGLLGNPDRVFAVGYHAGLELIGITITGGYTENSLSTHRDGGGIWNWNGTLTITDCLIEGNTAGEGGGGIANHYGTATITNTIIRDNTTYVPDYTSDMNWGGGIQNTGTMIVTGSAIVDNSTNKFGYGGGIANAGILEIVDSTILGNSAPVGGGLSTDWAGSSSGDEWRTTITSSAIMYNASGDGGGIFANDVGLLSPEGDKVTVTLTDTTVGDNHAAGGGGGIYNRGAVVEMYRSTLNENSADYGGAVYNSNLHDAGTTPGSVLVSNSTLSGNGALYGGAVANQDPGTTVLTNSTVTGNMAVLGGGIGNDSPVSTTLTIENTIIAGNEADYPSSEDCSGDITSLGYNLVGDATGCPADALGDVTTIDPMLSALGDFGGATYTHALLPGSPAINAGATDLTVDQRGILRPQGPADDIGAFEVEYGPNAPPVLGAVGDLVVDEGSTLNVTVSATDADEDRLVLWIAGAPEFVSLTDHGDGTAALSLAPGFDDAGSYPGVAMLVSDGVDLDEEVITIDVTDINAVPVADDQEVSTWQDNPVEIALTGSDEDGGDLAYAILEPPAHGGLSGTPPVVTYIPDSGFVGEDSFTFTVFDGEATSTPGTVALTVHNVRPDPEFGIDGIVIENLGYFDKAHVVLAQADGAILLAGWTRAHTQTGSLADAAIVKLAADGSRDLAFGTGGEAVVTGRDYYFYDLVVQPDGKIVAVGESKPFPFMGGDPLIARFDTDGALDVTFGSNGLVEPDLDGLAGAVALQPDGKIVVGGGWGSYEDLGALRLLANGDLDDSFGTDGVITVRHAGNDLVSEVLVQPNGSILLVGTIDRFHEWNEQNIALVRLLADGSPDMTFGDDGEAIIDFGMAESGFAATLQTDGKILIAGGVWEPSDRDAIVVRATSTGDLDPAFGSGGVANIAFGRDFEQFNDLVLQPDGTIVAAGSAGAEGSRDFIIARLLSDGSLDLTFDYDGKFTHDLGGDDAAWALAVQTDGKLLLAGQKDEDWAVLRLMEMDTNQPPVLDPIEDQSLAEADTLEVGITASDTDGDPLIFTLSGEPDFATLLDHGDGTATLQFTPGFDDAGVYPGLAVTASDRVASDSETFTITVTNTNQAPMLGEIGDQSVVEGDTLSVAITASDPDGDSLSFGIAGEPAFATLVDHGDDTATLSLNPGSSTAGVYPGVTITVSDSVDMDSETFAITVRVEETTYLFLPLVLRSQ